VSGERQEVLTAEEAARYLRVGERTLRRMLREGRLPGRKVGREWRIAREALDRYLKERPEGGETP